MRRDSSDTKRKILTVCVRLFLEQGYKNTSVSQIVDEAGVARGSYLNLFPTKDRVLLELTETMFGGQFGVARSIADSKLPPVYAYAVETALQLTLTELNENLREIYIEAYSLPETSEYIYLHIPAFHPIRTAPETTRSTRSQFIVWSVSVRSKPWGISSPLRRARRLRTMGSGPTARSECMWRKRTVPGAVPTPRTITAP